MRRIHRERREQKARDQSRTETTRDEVQVIIRYIGKIQEKSPLCDESDNGTRKHDGTVRQSHRESHGQEA